MATPLRIGLHGKITLFTCLLVASAVAALLLLHVHGQRQLLHAQAAQQARALIDLHAAPPMTPDGAIDAAALGAELTALRILPEVTYVLAFDPLGRVLHDGTPENAYRGEMMPAAETVAVLNAASPLIQIDGDTLQASRPFRVGGQVLGGISLGLSLASVQRASTITLYRALVIGGAFLLLSIILGRLFSHHLARPLRELAEATTSVTRGNFDAQIETGSHDEFGNLIGSFNKMTRVLKRWRIELTRSKEHTDNVIRSMLDMLIVVSPGGRIRTINAATCTQLSYLPEELTGQPIQQLIPEFPFDRFSAEGLIEGGFVHNMELFYMAKGGKLIPVSFSASAMRNEENRLVGIVCVAQDITERKRYERELVEAKETAEEMSRLKSAFLANMSHEIRTPLTGIIGFSQVLVQEVPAEQREFAEMIERGGKRLFDTLNSVLDLARLEAEEMTLLMEEVDVVEEIRESVALMQPAAQKKGLTLHVRSALPTVAAHLDRSTFNRIINNLVGNAIKFTETGHIIVDVEAEDAWVTLRVRDTGIGISDEFLPHLFDEFKQESTGEDRSYEGTGLGLAITKKLVDLYRGTIAVTSRKGDGTTFVIRLPRKPVGHARAQMARKVTTGDSLPQPSSVRVTPTRSRRRAERPRVLAVEDNTETQRFVSHVLKKDYDAHIVSTARDALQLARDKRFDVVLMDINLGSGEQSGLEVMRLLRRLPSYAGAPIIALTAYALPGDAERFLRAGFSDYLSKPFVQTQLLDKVEAALSGITA